jgi:hypothetical protein
MMFDVEADVANLGMIFFLSGGIQEEDHDDSPGHI